MPGPRSKHPSTRARRNNPTAGFTALPAAGRPEPAPEWPLRPEPGQSAALEHAEDKIAGLTAKLEICTDGRKRGGLRRQLSAAEQVAQIMRLQVEQQTDLEIELWNLLWESPQATMWEASTAFVRTLAQYVRWNVKGEQGDIKAATEARLRGKEFGLSPLTLWGLKAEIERAEEAEDKGNRRRSKPETKKPDEGDPRSGLYAV